MMEGFYNLVSLLVVDLLFKFEHLSFDLIDANTKKRRATFAFLVYLLLATHNIRVEALACVFLRESEN